MDADFTMPAYYKKFQMPGFGWLADLPDNVGGETTYRSKKPGFLLGFYD